MHNDILLKVNDLRASIDGKEILKGINLEIRPGEVHAIMGPNGSGKSTLSGVLAGDPRFTVTGGSATFHGVDLLALSPENRSHEGLSCRSSIRWRFPACRWSTSCVPPSTPNAPI